MNTKYKLSPSDFGYLWNDCKHCFYQKVKYGISHSGVFPAMFGRINNLLQNSVMGMNLKEINPNFPDGIVNIQEGFIKSVPLPSAEDCFVSGRFDILTKLNDGTYNLIDFKITTPDEEKAQKYASQLHAYKFALEHPANGKTPIQISRMGIISVHPEEMKVENGVLVFTAKPHFHEVPVDMEGFFALGKEISELLRKNLPQASQTCSLCQYRYKFSLNTKPVVNDLPF